MCRAFLAVRILVTQISAPSSRTVRIVTVQAFAETGSASPTHSSNPDAVHVMPQPAGRDAESAPPPQLRGAALRRSQPNFLAPVRQASSICRAENGRPEEGILVRLVEQAQFDWIHAPAFLRLHGSLL
jgi:hypothetical protein